MVDVEPCPRCGALPCDWVDNPHTPQPTGDVGALVEELNNGIHPRGCASESPNPGLACNCIRGRAAATILALTAEVEMKADTVEWFSADEPMGMRCAAVTTLTAEVEHKTFGQLEAVAQLKLLKSKLLGG